MPDPRALRRCNTFHTGAVLRRKTFESRNHPVIDPETTHELQRCSESIQFASVRNVVSVGEIVQRVALVKRSQDACRFRRVKRHEDIRSDAATTVEFLPPGGQEGPGAGFYDRIRLLQPAVLVTIEDLVVIFFIAVRI